MDGKEEGKAGAEYAAHCSLHVITSQWLRCISSHVYTGAEVAIMTYSDGSYAHEPPTLLP